MIAISESEIDMLVEAFYARVRTDPTIGPIFDKAVKDWPHHLALLKKFWATVLLTARTYQGDPLATHLKLPLERKQFERWLALFAETAHEVLAPDHAAIVIRKSEQIAKNFQSAIAYKLRQSSSSYEPEVLHRSTKDTECPQCD